MGFCSGVKRAMRLALESREIFPNKRIFTFGELIHNNEAIKFLEEKQIYALEKETIFSTGKKFSDAIIIVCAHGIEADAMKFLQKNFASVIDATCPHVLQSQKMAIQAAKENFTVILAGEKKHQEILSLKSCIQLVKDANFIVIQNSKEAKTVNIKSILPICLIGQTTFKQDEYESIIEVFSTKFQYLLTSEKAKSNLRIHNTICPATQKRQDALIELAGNCDAILVVGGKNSANTKRLFQTAQKLQPNSFLIENVEELPDKIYSFEKVGITAGASTPDFVIEKIKKKLC